MYTSFFKHGAILYIEAEVFSLSITNPNGRPMLPFYSENCICHNKQTRHACIPRSSSVSTGSPSSLYEPHKEHNMASNYKGLCGIFYKISVKVVKCENFQWKWLTLHLTCVVYSWRRYFTDLTWFKRFFLNPGFLFIKRRQGETLLSAQPAERSQKSQAKMYPRPQIHRRIQGQRLIFHFNSLRAESH